MSPLTEVAATADAIKQRLGAARSEFEEGVRQAERVMTRAQRAGEDAVDATVTQIRRRPLQAAAIAPGVGAFVGAAFGLAWSRWPARTKC